jgi:NarL family two-component system response regulator LiaR
MATRVLLVDDQAVVRQGLRAYLSVDPELEVVGEATDGADAVRRAGELRPDVVVMDLLLPVMDGVAATARIREELPETQVLVLASRLRRDAVVGAIRAGAVGCVLKDTDAAGLVQAVRAAATGQIQLDREAATQIVDELRSPSGARLTEREADVLRLLAKGMANKEIARTLGVGQQTVKSHVSNILAKLGVRSRTQAALLAARVAPGSVDHPDR